MPILKADIGFTELSEGLYFWKVLATALDMVKRSNDYNNDNNKK